MPTKWINLTDWFRKPCPHRMLATHTYLQGGQAPGIKRRTQGKGCGEHVAQPEPDDAVLIVLLALMDQARRKITGGGIAPQTKIVGQSAAQPADQASQKAKAKPA